MEKTEKEVELLAPILLESDIYYSSYFEWKAGVGQIRGDTLLLP